MGRRISKKKKNALQREPMTNPTMNILPGVVLCVTTTWLFYKPVGMRDPTHIRPSLDKRECFLQSVILMKEAAVINWNCFYLACSDISAANAATYWSIKAPEKNIFSQLLVQGLSKGQMRVNVESLLVQECCSKVHLIGTRPGLVDKIIYHLLVYFIWNKMKSSYLDCHVKTPATKNDNNEWWKWWQ